MRNTHKILAPKPEGKRPVTISKHTMEDNKKIDLKIIGCEEVKWIQLEQERIYWRALWFYSFQNEVRWSVVQSVCIY
jgi:hypothetical protein